jgi:uncharacterized protein (TIGR03083 family)
MVLNIKRFSEQMADDAAASLDASVEHCPGWSVRDLVVHIGDVQRFWVHIVTERLTSRPTNFERGLPSDTQPIAWFRSQTAALVAVLTTCADDVTLWTWWDAEQNAGWVKRRQMNEVVVHAWDAANAVGNAQRIPADVAMVGLREFVDVFSCDVREDVEPPPVALVATDCDWSAILFSDDATVVPSLELRGTASEILLSLWGRLPVIDPVLRTALGAIDLS